MMGLDGLWQGKVRYGCFGSARRVTACLDKVGLGKVWQFRFDGSWLIRAWYGCCDQVWPVAVWQGQVWFGC